MRIPKQSCLAGFGGTGRLNSLAREFVRRASILALALNVLLAQGCGGLVSAIDRLPENVRTELEASLNRLDQSVQNYEQIVEKQRVGLAQDVQGVVDSATLNLSALTEQAHFSVEAVLATGRNLEENTISDLKGLVDSVTARSEKLIAALQTSVDSTIRNAARELDRQRAVTLLQLNATTQRALGPIVAQLSLVEGKFVGQFTTSVSTWIVRLTGGSILLVGGIALVIGLGRGVRPLAIGSGVLAAFGTAFAFAAAPIARIGSPTIVIPSGEALCENMSKRARALEAFEQPKAKPAPPSMADAAKQSEEGRSFAWVEKSLREARMAATALTPAKGAMQSEPPKLLAAKADKEAAATEALQAASQCLTYAPNAARAAEASQTFTRALALISENVFCSFMADCAVLGKACDERIQTCLEWGDYCESHSDCALHKACDFGKRRCVPAKIPCSTPNDCRPEYACSSQVGTCLPIQEVKARGEACDTDAPVNSPCRVGKLDVVDRWVKCVQTTSAMSEVCDGIDNDCNGTVDEGQARPPGCDTGVGECQKRGTWACTNGGMVCTLANPRPEDCNNFDDDCDGVADNVPPRPCTAIAQGECRNGQVTCGDCVASAPRDEACDGLDNNCDGIADPAPVCPEVEIKRQGPDDNNGEMTERVSGFTAATDLINKTKVHGPSSCGIDEHGRPLARTRAEVWADSPHGATCTLSGPHDGFLTSSIYDCRIQVHYKTVQLGSNVGCNGVWWARPAGPYLR